MFKVNQPASWLFTGATTISILFSTTVPLGAIQAQSNGVNQTEILNAHNLYRRDLNLPALTWSDDLAKSAQQWADRLAATNRFEHSGTNNGENIWKGSAKWFSQSQMVGSWGIEKQNFVLGIFPDISKTGQWSDVGHYSQIIWRNTTEVGCGLATDGINDIFVCQYNPPGNYQGEKVY
ncbi:CAP family protein [Tumidithrix elongata RA019]|uniref:CAP family protein n=1 Tax=Tumidithrix elongata BACA0141 TaxID=2716417 RepID=A0AAW9PYT6_9CYAN|nr:CAP family protein [Tumidithrix elongata RA019]